MQENEIKILSFSTDAIAPEFNLKGDKKYYVKGFITTDEVDLYGDVVTPDSMENMVEQLQSGNIKLDVEHSQFRGEGPDIPIGRIVEAKKVEKDGKVMIEVKAELNSSHSKFKEVWKSVQDKFLDAFSIAYNVVKSSSKYVEGKAVQLLDEIQLLNVAITGNPVNPGAKMVESFMKAKYVRREGSAGDYKYYYDEPKKESEKESSIKKDPDNSVESKNKELVAGIIEEYEDLSTSDVQGIVQAHVMNAYPDLTFKEKIAKSNELIDEIDAQVKETKKKSISKENLKSEANTMAEEETNNVPVTPENEANPEVEVSAPAEAQQDEASVEVKSLKKEVAELKSTIDAQTKSISELKKYLEQPQLKALQEKPVMETNEETGSILRFM